MSNEKRKYFPDQTLDAFSKDGNDRFDLADCIGRVASSTKVYKLNGEDLTWWVKENDGAEDVIRACHADSRHGRIIKLNPLRANGPVSEWSPEMWDEAVTLSGVFVSFKINGKQKLLSVTSNIGDDFPTFEISGAVVRKVSHNLYSLLAEQTEGKEVTLITRSIPGPSADIEKVISLRSGGYAYIPQDEALALASDVCSDGDIEYWHVDNFLTEAVYAFPQNAVSLKYGRKKGDFIPYIRYFASDAGKSSCAFELGWNVNACNRIFLASGSRRVLKEHRGVWDATKATELRDDALGLKDKFVILQERMAELEKTTVLNQNIERTVKHLCTDTKLQNKKITAALVEYAVTEFAGTDCSAAELILTLIEAQNEVPMLKDLSDAQRNKLAHYMGEMVYTRIRQHA